MTYQVLQDLIGSMIINNGRVAPHFLVVLPEYLNRRLQTSMMEDASSKGMVIVQEGGPMKITTPNFTRLQTPNGGRIDLVVGDHIYIKQLN